MAVLDARRPPTGSRPIAAGGRRLRDELRDAGCVAAVSLATSAAATGGLWLLLRWLG